MPKIVRLITQFSQKDLDSLFAQAYPALRHRGLLILHAPRTKPYGRILIVVKRIVGNAVIRNKIRRQLRSIFYEEQLYTYPYDCVVIVKKEAVELSFEMLKKLLCQSYEKKQTS